MHSTPPPTLTFPLSCSYFPQNPSPREQGLGRLRAGAFSELAPHLQSLVESRLGTMFTEKGSAFEFPGKTVMGLGHSPPKGGRADGSGIEKKNDPSSFVNGRVFV